MTGTHRPAAAVGRNNRPIDKEQMDDLKNEQELARQKAKIAARRERRFSRVAQLLDQQSYITSWTHPCLFMPERNVQTEVSEYFPAIKVAIDKFYHMGDLEQSLCDFKKKALAKEGIKYAFLTPQINLADIADDLGVKIKADEEDPE